MAVDVVARLVHGVRGADPRTRRRRWMSFLTEEFQGIVTCDRAKMYWQVGCLQWCWAHFKRDFQAMIDGGDKRAKWLGEHVAIRHVRIVRALVPAVARAKSREPRWCVGWDRSAGRWKACCLRSMKRRLRRAGRYPKMYEHREWLWMFLRHEGVEPTNNAGEQSLRHAVIWRKLFSQNAERGGQPFRGNDADRHGRRQRRRDAFTFVTDVIQAHIAHQSGPSLLHGV